MLGATLLLTIGLLFVPSDLVVRLGAYGYLGVFVLTLLSSATIVLPSPALGVAALAGATLNPWLVGLVGGVAAGLGEITGYMAGLGGSSLAQRSRFYPRVERWVRRWGCADDLHAGVHSRPAVRSGWDRCWDAASALPALSGRLSGRKGAALYGRSMGRARFGREWGV